MNRRAVWIAVGAVLVAIAATAVVQHFRHPDFTKDVARSEQLDTAHVERKAASAKVDSAVHTLSRIGKQSLEAADRIHQVADTIGQGAVSIRDSLEMWKRRDSLHLVEIDSLRSRIRSDSLQKLLLVRDRDDWKHHSDSLVKSMDVLREDLKKAQADQCRILPFVPCPSRKEAAIAGVLVGLAITHPQQTKRIITLGR